MSIFKKDHAVYLEKMNFLQSVMLTEEKVKFSISYSAHEVKLEEVPKLLSDFIQLYAMVKPFLDKKALDTRRVKALKAQEECLTDSGADDLSSIDLSEIPF